MRSGQAPVEKPEVARVQDDAHWQAASRPDTSFTQRRRPGSNGYLARDVVPSARFVDHGVLQLTLAGGYPHRYRLGVALGLFDHLTLGVTSHWLPGQRRPHFAPDLRIAAYRGSWMQFGLTYDRSLYPAPALDDDPTTLSFARDTHWIMAAGAFSQGWVSAGFEVGTAVAREKDPGKMPDDQQRNPSRWRPQLGGGLFLRAGTRRWGFTATARAPYVHVDVAFDLRLGLFEKRPKGGWRP